MQSITRHYHSEMDEFSGLLRIIIYSALDCMPSLGMLTINAFVASDSVLIPVQAAYLPVRGLEQLIMTISRVKKHINPSIRFEGILISMVDSRMVYAREIIELVKENYGESLRIFDTMIPFSVRAAETSAAGVSIYNLYPEHKVAQAYGDLTEEVIASDHCDSKGGDGNE